MVLGEAQAREAQCYSRLGLSRGDIDGDERSEQKVTVAWRIVVKQVRDKPEELKRVNNARKILTTRGLREAYHAAIDKYNIEDGTGIMEINRI